MFFGILKKIFGSKNDRILKSYGPILSKINNFENNMKFLSDFEIKNKFLNLKFKCKNLNDLEDFLPLVYAMVREVAFRKIKMRHFDVQMLGGIAIYYGNIVEIATGEGKTLVATLPVCLYSLFSKNVHIVTVNDYLAKRDFIWMKPIYEFFDISVGLIISSISLYERKNSYKCNVVYGTNSEFGFDYLRDNIVLSSEEKVQKDLFFAILDEVDSILIDEARTPLIISMPDKFDYKIISLIDKIVNKIFIFNSSLSGEYFILDEKFKQVQLTDKGFVYLESLLKKSNVLNESMSLYDIKNIEILHYVHASLKAHCFFKHDVDYIIKDKEVLIIDEHTGRIMEGRRWSDGIHQAIEAKENLPIKNENQTLASITFQNYFRLYSKISGMTGTAQTEALEFKSIYGLDVITIPTNKSCIRIDKPDIIYFNKNEKFKAIINDIKECYFIGRPVLVGTVSIQISEFLSSLLKNIGIKHNVLNAKYHEKESQIISEAGKFKSVTIATNMAGRGTDIILGGTNILDKNFHDHEKIVNLGGLKVIGTERHESRRIDNQLRGRCGRQGDPGISQFYLSLEDDLIKIFIGEKTKLLLKKLNVSISEIITHPLISKSIENAQKKVEAHNFDIRKELIEYDDIINEQRKVFYKYRDCLIFTDDVLFLIYDIFRDVSDNFLDIFLIEENRFFSSEEILKSFNLEFGLSIHLNVDFASKDFFLKNFFDIFYEIYLFKKSQILQNKNFTLEKFLFLYVLDIKWKDHLLNLDYMKKGIHLRGYAQKDPKLEYKKESFELFKDMLFKFKCEFIFLLLKSSFNFIENFLHFDYKDVQLVTNSNTDNKKNIPLVKNKLKLGRNDICFCGSNKKYKQCHGKI